MKIVKSISLEDETWTLVDKKRGDVSRSKFIDNILFEYFNKLKGGKIK